jgi:hypothetical protein
MIIELKNENYRDFLDGEEFIVDGEKYELYKRLDTEQDDNTQTRTIILKRESDNKFFMFDISFLFCGYENWEYDADIQTNEMYEIIEKEVLVKQWVRV